MLRSRWTRDLTKVQVDRAHELAREIEDHRRAGHGPEKAYSAVIELAHIVIESRLGPDHPDADDMAQDIALFVLVDPKHNLYAQGYHPWRHTFATLLRKAIERYIDAPTKVRDTLDRFPDETLGTLTTREGVWLRPTRVRQLMRSGELWVHLVNLENYPEWLRRHLRRVHHHYTKVEPLHREMVRGHAALVGRYRRMSNVT